MQITIEGKARNVYWQHMGGNVHELHYTDGKSGLGVVGRIGKGYGRRTWSAAAYIEVGSSKREARTVAKKAKSCADAKRIVEFALGIL